MARNFHLLCACLFATQAMTQSFVTKSDSATYMSPDRPVTHVTTTAIPIQRAEDIPLDLQVPKEVVPGPVGAEQGAAARPEPVYVTVEAVPVELADMLPSTPKFSTGDQSGTSRPGTFIIAPPISAIHVSTLGHTQQPEAPSE